MDYTKPILMSARPNDIIEVDNREFTVKRMSSYPWICLQPNFSEDREGCKEICGPCQNGDHEHCQLEECDCE